MNTPKPLRLKVSQDALDIKLDEKEMKFLEELYRARPVMGYK